MTRALVLLDRVRRRAWLAALVAVLAVAAALAYALIRDETFVATSTLLVRTSDRPGTGAELARSYADLVGQTAYQQRLRDIAAVPEPVSISAATADGDAIIFVRAAAPDAVRAAAAAPALATTFRDQVNAPLIAESDRTIAELTEQLAAETARSDEQLSPGERSRLDARIISIQQTLTDLRTGDDGRLETLELDGGTVVREVAPVPTALLALAGGLLLGAAVAALSGPGRWLWGSDDVRRRVDLDTLAVIPDAADGSAPDETAALHALAALPGIDDLPGPATVAVAPPRGGSAATAVARALSRSRALQGRSTLLLHADLVHGTPDGVGVADVLRRRLRLEDVVRDGDTEGLYVVPSGAAVRDPYALFAPDRVADLVQDAHAGADLVVIDAPPVVEAAESQVVCAAADRTILVIEVGATTAADAVRARRLLEQAGAEVLGVVLTRAQRAERCPVAPVSADATPTTSEPGRAATSERVAAILARAAADAGPDGQAKKDSDAGAAGERTTAPPSPDAPTNTSATPRASPGRPLRARPYAGPNPPAAPDPRAPNAFRGDDGLRQSVEPSERSST